MSLIDSFEKMLADGRDDALLRYSLGVELMKAQRAGDAIEHLARAVRHDPDYSAAWKMLGKTREASGDDSAAADAYRAGIAAADRKGDKQAMKEMQVFLRRLEKRLGSR